MPIMESQQQTSSSSQDQQTQVNQTSIFGEHNLVFLFDTPDESILFRGDKRMPNEIFNDGFNARGSNPDVVRHLHGYKDSNYISTSKTNNVGQTFPEPFGQKFVYEVNNNACYGDVAIDAKPHIENEIKRLNPTGNIKDLTNIKIVEDVNYFKNILPEHEMMFQNKIQSTQIKGCYAFEVFVTKEKVVEAKSTYISNPNYVPNNQLLRNVGRASVILGVANDADNIFNAYVSSKNPQGLGNTILYKEVVRVSSGWSSAIFVGGKTASLVGKAMVNLKVPPQISLVATVSASIVGSCVGYIYGGQAGEQIVDNMIASMRENVNSSNIKTIPDTLKAMTPTENELLEKRNKEKERETQNNSDSGKTNNPETPRINSIADALKAMTPNKNTETADSTKPTAQPTSKQENIPSLDPIKLDSRVIAEFSEVIFAHYNQINFEDISETSPVNLITPNCTFTIDPKDVRNIKKACLLHQKLNGLHNDLKANNPSKLTEILNDKCKILNSMEARKFELDKNMVKINLCDNIKDLEDLLKKYHPNYFSETKIGGETHYTDNYYIPEQPKAKEFRIPSNVHIDERSYFRGRDDYAFVVRYDIPMNYGNSGAHGGQGRGSSIGCLIL